MVRAVRVGAALALFAAGCETTTGDATRPTTVPVPPTPVPTPGLALASPPPTACPDVPTFVASLPADSRPAPTFLDIAAGFAQTCAITTERKVVCWGTTYGAHRYLPEEAAWKAIPISMPKGFVPVAIDAGDAGGCVSGADATVACWGTPRPDRHSYNFTDAARVPRVRGVASMTVGYRGACAVTKGGEVWCWGEGWHHDLGTLHDMDPPADAVRIPRITNAVEVAVDQQRACARLATGEVTCWGNGNMPAPLAGVSDAVAIDIENERACAARKTGEVVCWEKIVQTPDSRLMHYTPHGEKIDIPPRVEPTPIPVPGITGAVDVALADHDCARDAAGAVTCWKLLNTDDGKTSRAIAAPAAGLAATRLSGGIRHNCVLDAKGVGWCWGGDDARSLGARVRLSSATPVEMCGVNDVVEVGTGAAFTCVRTRSGAVSCAGTNREQTVEVSYLGVSAVPRPTRVTDATKLSVAANHACAVRPGDKVQCWGKAELPFGMDASAFYPSNHEFSIQRVSSVAAGSWGDCGLRTDGGVVCWSSLGGGKAFAWEDIGMQSPVPGVTDAQQIAGTCVLDRSGSVVCWGDDFVKSSMPASARTYVAKMQWRYKHPPEQNVRTVWTNARSLAVGDGAACAIVGADVRCESLAPLSVPASLASGGAAKLTSLAVGGGRACAIDAAGAVDCWAFGAANTDPPLEHVPGLTDAVSVSVSSTHACAVRRTGTVACWGGDERGQLGAGPTPRAPTAVRVDVLLP